MTKSAGTSGAGRGDGEGDDGEAAAAAGHRQGPERNRSRRVRRHATAISGARSVAMVSWRARRSGGLCPSVRWTRVDTLLRLGCLASRPGGCVVKSGLLVGSS